MSSTENFYAGADYGLDPNYGEFVGYRVHSSDLGYPTDPTTANQIKATSDKISTGATTIEVSGVNIMGGGGPSKLLDSIPKQHFEEINRLKKLAGVDLTFHGPLIEPTGIGRNQWSELEREHAETEIVSALDRAHDLEPDGNIIVTFHTSNGLPEPRTRVLTEEGKEVSRSIAVIDERSGQFGTLPTPKEDHFLGHKPDIDIELKRLNNENWSRSLSNLNLSARRGADPIRGVIKRLEIKEKKEEIGGLTSEEVLNLYTMSGTEEGQKYIKNLSPESKEIARNVIGDIEHGAIFVKEAYSDMKEMFNKAYSAAEKSKNEKDKAKLDSYRKRVAEKLEAWKDNPHKIVELAEEVQEGVRVLGSIKSPEMFKPLEEFAIDKASETFSNAALKSYKKFKETTPIISVENPPVGMGLGRADEIRKLVKESRNKFVEKAQEDFEMSKSEAKKQADKLIGVTWDVGHINMIRKYGYGTKDLVKETKKIAPYVKHVHLSDNFGIEHTELPMGMGNVPTKPMLEAISKYNKQVKKIVETGDWIRQGGVNPGKTPVLESMRALGSPVYSMGMSPYWNQAASTYGSYSSGLGAINPDIHHQLYGAGFSNLPVDLGGQMQGRSRLSGAPME